METCKGKSSYGQLFRIFLLVFNKF